MKQKEQTCPQCGDTFVAEFTDAFGSTRDVGRFSLACSPECNIKEVK